jgi:hypothetical protein
MRIFCSLKSLLLLPALLAPLPLAAQVPENQSVRARYREVILGTVRENAAAPAALEVQGQGPRVQFRTERANGFLYSLFLNEKDSGFPVDGGGSWVIKRDTADGSFVQAKVFYRSDPGCFLRLLPSGGRTLLEVFLFGIAVDRRVQVPVAFRTLLTEPLARVVELTRPAVRWELLLAEGPPVEELARALGLLRAGLGALRALGEAEDGAMDEQGRTVRIADLSAQPGGLNCSGFAKWVVDGYYRPLTGRLLAIPELKQRHPELRGNRWSQRFEEARDPYFGLDWSRNLAAALARARGEPGEGWETWDVRRLTYLEYREDVGFAVEELPAALYLASLKDPGSFFIGSFNREYGSEPVLRQHYHLAVFFPYFSGGGDFRTAVFDLGRETTVADVQKRFAGHYVHLVRLGASGEWVAPRPAAGAR